MQVINQFLFAASLRGMGILNYRDADQSGERHFLERLAAAWDVVDTWPVLRPVVLDVGAHQGEYSRLVRATLPDAEIHAFEPHPSSAEQLASRLEGRVTIVASAVGSSRGMLDLYDYADADGSSHASAYRGVIETIHGRPSKALKVPVLPLDTYVEEKNLTHILLLKIDTEGHELRVLEGALSSLGRGIIECVQFEFNEMNVVSRSFLKDIAAALGDYELFRLLPRGMVRLRIVPLDELFAYQNIVAIRKGSVLAAALFEDRRTRV
jgi:FkbM family methyltransferase